MVSYGKVWGLSEGSGLSEAFSGFRIIEGFQWFQDYQRLSMVSGLSEAFTFSGFRIIGGFLSFQGYRRVSMVSGLLETFNDFRIIDCFQ